MTTALMTQDDKALAEVEKMETRIAKFLPGGNTIPADVRMGMAQLAIAHGLDPWLREVWPIPTKDKQGNITGWALMVGIAGWRSNATRSNEYWGRRFVKCTDEEREWLRAGPRDIAIKCLVLRRKTGSQPMEFDGYGLYRDGEYTKMNPLFAARLRAERDAMKAAFPINAPAGIELKYGDEQGDEINGYHGPQWESPVGDDIITGAELQAKFEENKKALGRDDGDLTAQPDPIPHFDPLPDGILPGQPVGAAEETSKWQVAYEGLQLPKAIHDAKLRHCNGDYEAAYKFATKAA